MEIFRSALFLAVLIVTTVSFFLIVPYTAKYLAKVIRTTFMIMKTMKWYEKAMETVEWMHDDDLLLEVRRLSGAHIQEEDHDVIIDWLLGNQLIQRRQTSGRYCWVQAYEYRLMDYGSGGGGKKQHRSSGSTRHTYAPA